MKTSEENMPDGLLRYVIFVYQTFDQEEANLATLEFTEPSEGFLNSTIYEDCIFNPETKQIRLI